jgi:Flp pilus assembly protein TadG
MQMKRLKTCRQVRQFCRSLWEDTSGVILPYITLLLVVIIGTSLLALDGARLMDLQTQLQNAADAYALAGAAELDRLPDSIDRANRAIDVLMENRNSENVGDEAEFVTVARRRFLSSLPASDKPVTSLDETSDPTLARFIEVTVTPVAMHTIMPTVFLNLASAVATGAQAVGGYDQVLCNAVPLLVCNPFEENGMTHYAATQALVNASSNGSGQRKLIRLARTRNKNDRYRPGDFGYPTPVTGSLPVDACGPNAAGGMPQALAANRAPACFRMSGVNLQPGNDQLAVDGLNTRFDIYANSFSSCTNYPADRNVRKGYITVGNANWCKASPSGIGWPIADHNATALPVDQNMIITGSSGRQVLNTNVALGNGTWDCTAYWSEAHPVRWGHLAPPGCTATATISRYSVYQYEIGSNSLYDRSLGAETGAPQCNPHSSANRRILYGAIVNCLSSPVIVQVNARNVPVAAFGKFFLVLPATKETDGNIYAELNALIRPSDHLTVDSVELYR